MSEAKKRPFSEQVREIYPGREVVVEGDLRVRVFPVGLRQVEAFTRAVAGATAAVMGAIPEGAIERPGVGAPPGTVVRIDPEALMKRVVPALVAAIARDLLELVGDC